MSKSPYLSNPNILAHPDRVVQSVALDMTAQDSYLAGSPISAEGKLANDQTAIGILLYDVHKQIGGTTGVVVISGRIDQEVAAEHSGVTISDDCKAALIDISFTGDGSRMGGGGGSGPIDPKRLPEGYPYKEGMTIEWDGNIEGKDCVADRWYHVSDEVISNENLKIGTITMSTGNSVAANTNWDNYVSAGNITEDFAMVADGMVVVVRTPNASYMEATFEKTGVYFMRMSDVFYITKLSAETIHPMAPEFLPAGGGGGVQVVTLETDGTTFTSSHTGAEIKAMGEKGLVFAHMYNAGMLQSICLYVGTSLVSLDEYVATFVTGGVVDDTAMLTVVSVPQNEKTFSGGQIVS